MFIFCDFVACSLSGVILGLRIQKRQMILTGIGYILIGLPLMYLFAFKVGSHSTDYEYSFFKGDLGVEGLGSIGLWFALSIGSIIVVVGQIYLINQVKVLDSARRANTKV